MEEMVENGHEVIVCAPSFPEYIKKILIDIGVEPIKVNFNRVGINPVTDIQDLSVLVGIFKKLKPDKVLFYTIKPVVYGSICAKIAHIPFVSSIITGLGYSFIGKDFRTKIIKIFVIKLYKIALRFNSIIFFQNPDDLKLFSDLKITNKNINQTLINGSGVDTKYFYPQNFPTEISFLLIARLIKDKGILEYIEAASIIKNKGYKAKFYLVGFIDRNPTAIKKQDLDCWTQEGVVEYLGMLDDVRPAIANSSVYVLPSYREGTPRTVLEAMAMGRPIITTDAPGCRETVREGINGFLVPVKNVPALVEAMEKFIYNPTLIPPMGMESRKIAEEKYEVTKVNQVIMKNLGLVQKKTILGNDDMVESLKTKQ